MFNVGGWELLVILLVALIILGPERLPTVARQMGQWAAELKRVSGGFQDEIKSAIDVPEDVRADLKAVINAPRQIREGITNSLSGAGAGPGAVDPRSPNKPPPAAADEPIVKSGEYQAAEQPTMRAGDDIEKAAAEAAKAGQVDEPAPDGPSDRDPPATEAS
ncbi:MAG: twin-arginine translocase subunit TatB [Actinomycetia bacterium]|nr:twin-arginine translocase subunit TatB [Actinomycetes bacterium]